MRDLHALYIRLTGLDIRLDMARERDWFEWQRRGFTPDDLQLVIRHLQRGIREGKRNPGALKFSNLITMADRFEEDLAEARAAQRARRATAAQRTDRASVLRSTGRPAESAPAQGARSVEELIAEMRKAANG